MNKVDLLIVIVVAIPALLGFRSGLLKNILAFAGVLIGLFFAVRFYEPLAALIEALNIFEKLSTVISFATIIVFFYFLGVIIANKITKISVITSALDKIAGIVFGVLQGLIIASLILLFINSMNFIPRDIINDSQFYPFVVDMAPTAFNIVSSIFPSVKTFFEELQFLKK